MTTGARQTLLRRVVHASLRFRFLVVAAGVVMMVLGVTTLPAMRVDVFPEFAPPRVEIQTQAVGLTTADVEQLVTVPLEQALNGLPGLDQMRSKSVHQLSSIKLIFTKDTDQLQARQLVQERLAEVAPSLPTWAAPPVILAPLSATSRAVKIGMTSDQYSVMEMSMTAYWTVRARLLQVPGVANVAMWNERIQMMTVQVEPDKLAAQQVALDDVMEVTADAVDSGLLKFSAGSVIGTGGLVETPNQRVGVRHVLPVVTPADLGEVSVPRAGGGFTQLSEVATVKEDYPPLIGSAIVNDGPGLLLVVEKLPWANTLELTRGVDEAIRSLEPGLPGVRFDTTIFQQASFIEIAIRNLSQSLVLGFLLVVVILALFLFEWRVALISVLTIPLSLMATMLVLYWRGETINTMTLAGLVIALGAVVDDAIIDVENIVRRLRQHRRAGSSRSTSAIILEASLEVRSPIVYATLIIIAASVPIFLLQGLTGSFFQPLAVSYTLAIAASLVVAMTVTPALCLIMLRKAPIERRESPVVRRLQSGYTRGLATVITRPRPAYAVVGVVTLVGLVVAPQLGQSLFPSFKERDFLMHWVSEPGTTTAEMERTMTLVSRDLRAIPGVRNFGTHIGQAMQSDEIYGVNFGENWISVDPSADYDETIAEIKSVVASYPGLFRDVKTYLKERVGEVASGAGEPIVMRIYGDDLSVLRAKAEEVKGILAGTEGVVDAHSSVSSDMPQLEVKADLARAGAYGLKPGDIRRAAATMVAGEEVGDIFRAGRAYDVVVWSTPESRNNPQLLADMLIDTPTGEKVRLGDVASVQITPSPNSIEREADSRYLDVGAQVEGRDIGSVVEDFQYQLEAVAFPRGYHAVLLGEYAERQAADRQLLVTAGLALVAILLLLQAAFGSWRLAWLALLTLPMALVGGVLAAWATGGIVSLGSLVGFFTVFGLSARNGILLINHCQHLEREEGEPFGPGLVMRGARERLSPILMTTLAAGLALVPLVALGERPGQEIEHPLAIVILGGLVTSTLLNLFVLPSLYLRFAKPTRAAEPVPPERELVPAG
jgi:CzcA family heavy metal efflux pump